MPTVDGGERNRQNTRRGGPRPAATAWRLDSPGSARCCHLSWRVLWATAIGEDAPLGESIVSFARSKVGQKIGDGECTSLAVQALRHCHAQRPDPVRGVWGDEIKALRDLQPGDILQFENATFVKQHVRDDGAILTLTSSYPHHTAIVARVRKRGPKPVLVILHQNASVPGDDAEAQKLVTEWTLEMATKRGGTVTAYRPVPAEQGVRRGGKDEAR